MVGRCSFLDCGMKLRRQPYGYACTRAIGFLHRHCIEFQPAGGITQETSMRADIHR